MSQLISFFKSRVDRIRGESSHAKPKETEQRQKLKRELYEYNQFISYGFPHKPSALAYDAKLDLLAIATRNGALRIVGAPGVEFYGQHTFTPTPGEDLGEGGGASGGLPTPGSTTGDLTVTQMVFLPDEGRLMTLTSDNVLHLWEITTSQEAGSSKLTVLRTFTGFAHDTTSLKIISAICLMGSSLLLGTEGGNVHFLNVLTFQLSEQIISQEVIMQTVSDDVKMNPGAVESIKPHPSDPCKFLIGYNRGLIALWDLKENISDQIYNATQQLEALTWHCNGEEFMSAHADGSYIVWSADDGSKPKEVAEHKYGPFPCKAITKIDWKAKSDEDPYIIFSGGMPRSAYGDHNTVSVIQGEKHITFDFTSRVVDFLTITSSEESEYISEELTEEVTAECSGGEVNSLIVLLEEELVAIDLSSDKWPLHRLPYLHSMHSSAITSSQHVSNIPISLWTKIREAGASQFSASSAKPWPIAGGRVQRLDDLTSSTPGSGHQSAPAGTRDLLLTGHEDGSVRFWDASHHRAGMTLLYKLDTSGIFAESAHEGGSADDDDEAEDWLPFRKVGTFDPYSDDPRLGIQRIFLCPLSDIMVVAGTAGQVVVLQMEREERAQELKAHTINIVGDRENFVWKGHECLTTRSAEGEVTFKAGFQPQCVVQLSPPAACTALSVHTEWQLMAAGTAHGFALFDFRQKSPVLTQCTLAATETEGSDETQMSRRKTFKKSLRESFRRLRRRRSMSKKKAAGGSQAVEEVKAGEEGSGPSSKGSHHSPKHPKLGGLSAGPSAGMDDMPIVERQIEARAADDAISSHVKTLYFADTYLLNTTTHSPSLWAGTNRGVVYLFAIILPANDKRDSEKVSAQLAKEVHLKHRAPVTSLAVVDRSYYPLPQALEVQNERAKAPDMTGNHRLVVISEEQFKIFSLPTLKAEDKWKLTAHEGTRVRKVGYVNFRSRSDDNYSENNIVCLTNCGDFSVYTVKGFRRQLRSDAISKNDISAIASAVFTSAGDGYFLAAPSEFHHFSLSAACPSKPLCTIDLKEGARVPLASPQPVVNTNATGDGKVSKRPVSPVSPAAEVGEERGVDISAGGDGGGGGLLTGGGGALTGVEVAAASGIQDTSLMSSDITKDDVREYVSEVISRSSSIYREQVEADSNTRGETNPSGSTSEVVPNSPTQGSTPKDSSQGNEPGTDATAD